MEQKDFVNGRCAAVLGYGIPPDIFSDGNYERYLSQVLERCFDRMSIRTIVMCGGHTNTHFPEKTEAGEMAALFAKLNSQKLEAILENFKTGKKMDNALYTFGLRHAIHKGKEAPKIKREELVTYVLQKFTETHASFQYQLLDTGITSWDNIQQLKDLLLKNNCLHVIIFCESSRFFKIQLLCLRIFPRAIQFDVFPIDFDQSKNRKKTLKQLADFLFTLAQCAFPALDSLRNRLQRRHIAKVSQR